MLADILHAPCRLMLNSTQQQMLPTIIWSLLSTHVNNVKKLSLLPLDQQLLMHIADSMACNTSQQQPWSSTDNQTATFMIDIEAPSRDILQQLTEDVYSIFFDGTLQVHHVDH